MIRDGSGEPLVLLHGLTNGERVWTRVVPLLTGHHEVIAPTALGHHGGRPSTARPVRIADVTDDFERLLDELGFSTVHLAGNSMGGWVALELARRGRARSVCAFSPAGTWEAGEANHSLGRQMIRRTARDVRLSRVALPALALSRGFRRWALRTVAVHGDRLDRTELLGLCDDLLGCTTREDLLSTPEQLLPLNPVPCPITLAWSAEDRILPLQSNGVIAQARVPEAHYISLADVGHIPMIDDPELVARTILETTASVTVSGA
jgi:pimeloyl-ACP methyl ester carboxylesterase